LKIETYQASLVFQTIKTFMHIRFLIWRILISLLFFELQRYTKLLK